MLTTYAVCLLLIPACSGSNSTPKVEQASSAVLVTQPFEALSTSTISEQDILRAGEDFHDLEAPEGLDSATWQQLGNALIASLGERGTSKLPDEARNTVDDLEWIDNGGGDYSLEWTFRNAGDYDNNGIVNVSDLSSIGVHFGKDSSSPDWNSARTADGDGNGIVNIADVSPIGINFQSQVLGYNIYASDYEDGPWLLQGSIELAEATKNYPRRFSYAYGTQGHAFVTVSPFDTSGADIVSSGGGTAARFVGGGTITPGPSAIAGPDTSALLEGEAGTPLEGISVEIPSGARVEPTSISIGYSDGQVLPVAGEWSGVILDISGPSDLLFEEPVLITVPFSGAADEIPVPYYIHENGSLEDCLVTNIDRTAGSMTFMTMHASLYTWVIARLSDLDSDYSVPGYSPGKDGFQIVNWGSSFNNGGECFGMAGFAQWYYRNFRSDGELYPRFMYFLGTGADNKTVWGQDAIATRAHNSLVRVWLQYIPTVDWKSTAAEDWVMIRHAILNNAAPSMLYITDFNGNHGHAVLAYGWNGNDLLIYDVNRPNQVVKSTFVDSNFSGFGNTNGGTPYVFFRNTGMGSFMRENFLLILADAEGKFSGSADTVISGMNYEAGDVVNDRTITLTGDLESSQVLADRLSINNGFSIIDAEVDIVSQTFVAEVPIRPGDNYLKFITKGVTSDSNVTNLPNNFTLTRGLHLIGDFEPEKLRITLTWDELNMFGMYVEDPNGELLKGTFMENANRDDVTADGAQFVGKYFNKGPLSYVIPHDGTLRSGDYRFRVFNNSVIGSQQVEIVPANWQVTVSFNDGLPQVFSGRLEEGNQVFLSLPGELGFRTEWFVVTNE